jgi:hypothetical protein
MPKRNHEMLPLSEQVEIKFKKKGVPKTHCKNKPRICRVWPCLQFHTSTWGLGTFPEDKEDGCDMLPPQ